MLGVVTLALVAVAAMPASTPSASGTPRTTFSLGPGSVNLEVIGDSYTGGSAMGGNDDKGWASLVASGHKGPSKVLLDKVAEGGAGYAAKGQVQQTLPEFYAAHGHPDQDTVVVFAGLNDQQAAAGDIGAAASKLYGEIRKASPKAALVVVGPAWPHLTPTPGILAVRDAIKAAAVSAGARFVDPIADGWFMGADHRLIGADGTHPTDEGHRYMADKLAPVIDAALDKAAAG